VLFHNKRFTMAALGIARHPKRLRRRWPGGACERGDGADREIAPELSVGPRRTTQGAGILLSRHAMSAEPASRRRPQPPIEAFWLHSVILARRPGARPNPRRSSPWRPNHRAPHRRCDASCEKGPPDGGATGAICLRLARTHSVGVKSAGVYNLGIPVAYDFGSAPFAKPSIR
jgi:hypothetical protein